MAERERSLKPAAVDSRGGGSRWSAGRRSAPEADGFRKEIFCGARRARSASGWQHPSAWRGPRPWRLPALHFRAWLGLAWLDLAWLGLAYGGVDDDPVAWTMTRMPMHRENGSVCIFSSLPAPRLEHDPEKWTPVFRK